MRRLLYAADAWWPTLSNDGRDLVAGNTLIKAWHLPAMTTEYAAAHWTIGPGRDARHIRPSIVTYTVERSPLTRERWEFNLRSGAHTLITADEYGLVAGNEFDARDGHWASYLDITGRIVYDGRVVAHGGRHVAVAGDLLLYVQDDRQLIVRNMRQGGHVAYPLPPTAHEVTLTADGYVGCGYYNPPIVVEPGGNARDVTVTPWRAESVPVLCRVARQGMSAIWVWTFSARPGDNKGLVLGRPLHDPNSSAIVIEDFIADAYMSVAYRAEDDSFIVAGNASEGGVASVWHVPYATPRIAVKDAGVVPDPQPEPEEEVKAPGITVTEYGKELTPAGTWRLRFNDRNNDCNVTVSIVNGRLTVEMSNSKGTDRTGSVRQVTIHD